MLVLKNHLEKIEAVKRRAFKRVVKIKTTSIYSILPLDFCSYIYYNKDS
nr:MAG TPA: hypothetical protein [Caudoviricetes sp.]